MKIEYERNKDDSECVAYIDAQGHLVVKDQRVVEGNASFVFMPNMGKVNTTYWDEFNPYGCKEKFYPGDKITITF